MSGFGEVGRSGPEMDRECVCGGGSGSENNVRAGMLTHTPECGAGWNGRGGRCWLRRPSRPAGGVARTRARRPGVSRRAVWSGRFPWKV